MPSVPYLFNNSRRPAVFESQLAVRALVAAVLLQPEQGRKGQAGPGGNNWVRRERPATPVTVGRGRGPAAARTLCARTLCGRPQQVT